MTGSPPRVLLLTAEFPIWHQARHWSYTVQLGFEEGLAAHGVEPVTATSPWLPRVPDILRGQRFDQIWADVVHAPLCDRLLEWMAAAAPVRVGFVGESLGYTAEECRISRLFGPRKRLVEHRLASFTHALSVDERDVDDLNAARPGCASWCPVAVPQRFVCRDAPIDAARPALFVGALYGDRASWIDRADLAELLSRQRSPDRGTADPVLFDLLQCAAHVLRLLRLGGLAALRAYLRALRAIRRRCFGRWLDGMRSGSAVVNLPTVVKCHASRVVEGMAAGRPVVTWAVPDRPRTNAQFEDGREILLFSRDRPEQLAAHLRRLRADPALARRLVEAARDKVLRAHTMEQRVGRILRWIDSGEAPRDP